MFSSLKKNFSAVRLQAAGDQVEQGGLASSVWSYD